MSMYQLAENMELMSKVVEQVTSGMKSILQHRYELSLDTNRDESDGQDGY